MGWNISWYSSSYDSDFNYDFHVTLNEFVAPYEYNYLTNAELVQAGVPVDSVQSMEVPGRRIGNSHPDPATASRGSAVMTNIAK
jgi:predicted dithiol-disulfide oxidoreductase (DUF899 family)